MSLPASLAIAVLASLAAGCASRSTPRVERGGASDAAPTGTLRVEVIAPDSAAALFGPETSLRAALFTDSREWPSGTPDFRVRSTFIDGRGTAFFEAIPTGRYAIIAFVDLDGDGELDRGAFGVPIEPIAYGNDAKPRFGPPAFEACLVEVGPAPHAIELVLRVD